MSFFKVRQGARSCCPRHAECSQPLWSTCLATDQAGVRSQFSWLSVLALTTRPWHLLGFHVGDLMDSWTAHSQISTQWCVFLPAMVALAKGQGYLGEWAVWGQINNTFPEPGVCSFTKSWLNRKHCSALTTPQLALCYNERICSAMVSILLVVYSPALHQVFIALPNWLISTLVLNTSADRAVLE